MKKAKWWQIILIIIVLYPLGAIIGRLIAGKPVTWDEMSPFLVASLPLGIIAGLLYRFISKDKAKWEQQQREKQQQKENNNN